MSESLLKFIVTVTVITFVLVLHSGHTILFEMPAMHRGRFTNRRTNKVLTTTSFRGYFDGKFGEALGTRLLWKQLF